MSGHSKWANIKHRKSKTDAQRGKIFTKIGREISIVVKQGGADPELNSKLKEVLAKAREYNMPNDTILRSINKASINDLQDNYQEVTYEGYGPGGIAVMVETATDNRNRTAGDIRHLFDKFGGNLGALGCVSFIFEKKGLILVEKSQNTNEDDFVSDILDSGAEDFNSDQECVEVITDPSNFADTKENLTKKGYQITSSGIQMIPNTYVKLTSSSHVDFIEKLLNCLEDLDDVQNVYHNWECE